MSANKGGKKIGWYAWAGPGTERMIKLKYFDAPVDHNSLQHSYDYDYLARVVELFGVTDAWATYSWGFADDTEEEDRRFLLDRLENFHRLGIRVHAYVQGPNLVTRDFSQYDWWARDLRGRTIPYHRGRSVTCLRNPGFRAYQIEKIKKLCASEVDGIFIDNIQMGHLGLPDRKGHTLNFTGCACKWCRDAFRDYADAAIPPRIDGSPQAQAWRKFRIDTTTHWMRELADLAHAHGKIFGSNSYDPKYPLDLTCGTDLTALSNLQDYLLFETHALRTGHTYLEHVLPKTHKDIFVVSYRHGIGYEEQFTQQQLDILWAEHAASREWHICLKGSEFVTQKTWHNLRLDGLRSPDLKLAVVRTKTPWYAGSVGIPIGKAILGNLGPRLTRWFYEHKSGRYLLGVVYRRFI